MRAEAVVLAAGASTRMGRLKALLPVRGRTLLASAVSPFLDAGLARVVVVLGFQADVVRAGAGLPEDARLAFAVNEDWPSGLSSSLRAGLAACPTAEAVIVALGDQPNLRADLVGRLVAAAAGGAPLVVPMHDGRVGHPILFRRELFDELRQLSGDAGAREVVRRHIDRAAIVAGDPPRDLDTEADYAAFLEGRPGPEDEGFPLPPRTSG
jgi:CTP:molybdopterin cytidylyltransferase MocA